MIFEALHGSAKRGELLLIDGGYCRWHQRRDGQLTVLEILSTRPGAGREMFEWLRQRGRVLGSHSVVAKCPADLPANVWYRRRGFTLDREEATKSGRKVNVWRYRL